jgi:hypothetical protein
MARATPRATEPITPATIQAGGARHFVHAQLRFKAPGDPLDDEAHPDDDDHDAGQTHQPATVAGGHEPGRIGLLLLGLTLSGAVDK